jgi:guanylate kinase
VQTIFVISGPTNAGKTTIMSAVMALGLPVSQVITSNSRAPRPDETDGVQYHFFTREEFERRIAADEFIEWAVVHNDYKGVLRSSIFEDIPKDRDIMLQLDVQGFNNIKRTLDKSSYRVVGIFIEPPDMDAIVERMRKRGVDTDTNDIKKRLDDAEEEMEQRFAYDYIVVNDVLAHAVEEVAGIIRSNLTPPETGELF